MDIRCPRCGEPTDLDELHYVDPADHPDAPTRTDRRGEVWVTFDAARAIMREHGCGVLFSGYPCVDNARARIVADLWDLAGEDVDGLASDLEALASWADELAAEIDRRESSPFYMGD